MSSQDLREKLREILQEMLELAIAPGADVDRASTPAWNSLNHLRVVISVEDELSVRFDANEVVAVGSLRDLEALVRKKLARIEDEDMVEHLSPERADESLRGSGSEPYSG
jgi:acyl carrier protein